MQVRKGVESGDSGIVTTCFEREAVATDDIIATQSLSWGQASIYTDVSFIEQVERSFKCEVFELSIETLEAFECPLQHYFNQWTLNRD